ncbi:hypothetical protein [Bradyrhizobium sp. F1.13.3]|uniref:hypothetical protein n=1 Tax=Bradyrhizobium sp. F1.13.3 TaxID=3156351 RepID=UPI0033923130
MEATMAQRPIHEKGEFLIGGAQPAEDPRRSRVVKGMRMVSTPAPGPLPQRYAEFEGAAEVADRLGAEEKLRLLKEDQSVFIHEMAQRFARLRSQLDEVAKSKIIKARK